jgi:hypothetical protein
MFPLFWGIADPHEQQAYLRQMVTTVLSMRQDMLPESAQYPFDVIVVGATPPDRPEESETNITGFAAAGATWWLESLAPEERGGGTAWSFYRLRERVLAGPLGGK